MADLLKNGNLDIVVGGSGITPIRALTLAYSDAYMQHNVGLIVLDSRRGDFSSLAEIQQLENLKLGVPNSPYYTKTMKTIFTNATFTTVRNPRNYFKGKHKDLDAMIYSAETGSAWSMLYPEYGVVIPKGLKLKAPLGLTLPKGQRDYVNYINTWLQLKKDSGQLQKIYNYGILGKNPKAKKPRWSIMKDVLGWSK